MNAVDPSNYTSSFGSVASRSAGRATVPTIWVAVALLLQGLRSTRDHVRAVNEMSQPTRHDGATLAAKRLPGARRYFPLCLELLVVAPFDAAAMLMRGGSTQPMSAATRVAPTCRRRRPTPAPRASMFASVMRRRPPLASVAGARRRRTGPRARAGDRRARRERSQEDASRSWCGWRLPRGSTTRVHSTID